SVDITFHQGLLGLVGPSGAGKTTLLQLLAGRLTPTEGHIELDDYKLASLDHEGWEDQVAYIPQHPYIFPLTLADNIRFYEPTARDSEIDQLIQRIGLSSYVVSLPSSMHEKIGEGGRTLSGGLEQRIAPACPLLSDKNIILLDGTTARL